MDIKKMRPILVLALLLAFAGYLFSGPLFILSPIKPGYHHLKYQGTIEGSKNHVYVDKDINDDISVDSFNKILQEEETFHDIPYKRKFDIYICRNDAEARRIFPFFSTKSAGFAGQGYFMILNYENMIRLGYDVESIVKHEASHILLHQHMKFSDILRTRTMNNWFKEGIAVFHQGLWTLSRDELRSALQDSEVIFHKGSCNFQIKPKNYRAEYALLGYFTKYLHDRFGEERMQELIHLMIQKNAKGDSSFSSVYSAELEFTFNQFLDELKRKER